MSVSWTAGRQIKSSSLHLADTNHLISLGCPWPNCIAESWLKTPFASFVHTERDIRHFEKKKHTHKDHVHLQLMALAATNNPTFFAGGDEPGCGGEVKVVEGVTGMLKIPQYGCSYHAYMDCAYRIVAPEGTVSKWFRFRFRFNLILFTYFIIQWL